MTPKDYIIKKMDQLVVAFPCTEVRYECDDFRGIHTVQILPQSEYNKEAMLNWRSDVFDEFFKLYPAEAITFISEDFLVGIENSDEIRQGSQYTVPSQYSVAPIYPVVELESSSWTYKCGYTNPYSGNFNDNKSLIISGNSDFSFAA